MGSGASMSIATKISNGRKNTENNKRELNEALDSVILNWSITKNAAWGSGIKVDYPADGTHLYKLRAYLLTFHWKFGNNGFGIFKRLNAVLECSGGGGSRLCGIRNVNQLYERKLTRWYQRMTIQALKICISKFIAWFALFSQCHLIILGNRNEYEKYAGHRFGCGCFPEVAIGYKDFFTIFMFSCSR